ncbi:MAG: hypothetical protein IJ877_06875 [Candidatus Gastranaerophilales bacterium]|nr:hypothetical protein [Candidatus Gastranaerophilales bacterium]
MNFSEIKSGFIEYLIDKECQSSNKQREDIIEDDINLFSHLSDFRKYLVENNIADSSIFSKSLKDIENMRFVDGKLVETGENSPDSENLMLDFLNDLFQEEEVVSSLDEDESGDLDINEITGFLTEIDSEQDGEISLENLEEPVQCIYMLGTIYDDEDSLKYLDSDNDGEISPEEKEKFEAFVKGDKENLTLEDLENTYASIKDGSFPVDDYKNFSIDKAIAASEDKNEALDDLDTLDTSSPSVSSGGVSSGGGVSGSYGGGAAASANTTPVTASQTPTENLDPLEGKTSDELQQMRDSKELDLKISNNALQAIFSGADPDVAQQQEKCDNAQSIYKTMLEADDNIDSELKEQEMQVLSGISDYETQINNANLSICRLGAFIASQKAKIALDETNLQSLQSALSALPAQGSDKYPENENRASAIEANRAELTAKISQAQAKLEEDKAKLNEPQESGRNAEDELSYLSQELPKMENELTGLQEQKELLEHGDKSKGIKGILDTCSPETKLALENYNQIKDNLETLKEQKIESISKTIQTQTSELNEIDNKIKEVLPKETSKKYAPESPLFDKDFNITMNYVNDRPCMNYLLIGPENPDPNEELPVIVYLHGSGEVGSGENGMYRVHGPGGFINDLDLENFNGYIICPHLSGEYNAGSWTNGDAEKYLREMLDDFQNTHAVDSDKIALTGASLGGAGVIYQAQHMNDVFCKAVSMSGYPNSVRPQDITSIPIIGIVGGAANGEDGTSINYMKNNFSLQEGNDYTHAQSGELYQLPAGHAYVPKTAFGMDSNGNGCSDLIEWLFDYEQ